MSIKIENYEFEGPYPYNTSSLKDNSGVYVILCYENDESNEPVVIDVGESATVKSRIENHDRVDCWNQNCSGTLNVAVLYTQNKQQSGRKLIEQELRKKSNGSLPCGKR